MTHESDGAHALTSVCVYCGSRLGHAPRYRETAARLGRLLGERGMRLVYGGGHVGLMGLVADAALAAGGRVTGVIPRHLLAREVGHEGLSELVLVDSMHERKLAMFERSDAFLALPGGIGTLDETIEMITWRQLGLHRKPIVFIDDGGYWRPLMALMERIVAAGFAGPGLDDLFLVAADPEEALAIAAGALG